MGEETGRTGRVYREGNGSLVKARYKKMEKCIDLKKSHGGMDGKCPVVFSLQQK